MCRRKITPQATGAHSSLLSGRDPQMANGNAADAHYGCVLGHLMNNSYRLGEQLPFDLKSGRFGDNADAAEHFAKLHAVMAEEWACPSTVRNTPSDRG